MSPRPGDTDLRLLVLDFDGVIADSAPETFVVGLRTYLALYPDSSVAAFGEDLAEAQAPTAAAVAGSPIYARFVELMPLGNRAEDFGVVIGAIDADVALPDQTAYDALRASWDPALLRDYHERFYRTRRALAACDLAGWLALTGPFPLFLELLRRRAGDAVLAIATAKDRQSVRALLRSYGIEDLFAEERVLDKEAGEHKTAHLKALRTQCDVAFEEITFLDDKVSHLDAVAGLGVRCALAGWGYNGAREASLARERGYLYCTLDDAETRLFC